MLRSGSCPSEFGLFSLCEGILCPVRSTADAALPPFARCPSAVRSDVVAWQPVQVRVQEVSKAGITKCDGRSVNRYHSRQPGNQWHSFSEFCHSVKDSVLGLGYPLIFYSVSELPVLPFFAATFRPVFGIAAQGPARTEPLPTPDDLADHTSHGFSEGGYLLK